MKFKAKRKDLDSLSLAGGQMRIYARGDTDGDIYEIASELVSGTITWCEPLNLTAGYALGVDASSEIASTLGPEDKPRVYFRDGAACSSELYCDPFESSPMQLRSGPGTGQMTACRASSGALHAACVSGSVFDWVIGSVWSTASTYPASNVEALCLGVGERLLQLCRPELDAVLLVDGEALELPNDPTLLGLGRARGCPLPKVLGQVGSNFVVFTLVVDSGLVIASAAEVLDPSVIEVDEESIVTTANGTYLFAKVLIDDVETWQLRELGGAVIRDGLVGPEPGAITAATLADGDHLVHVDASGQLWHIAPPALPGAAWVATEILSPALISIAS